ncbi:NAD(P)H-binding protein [Burkholderia sp. BCCIQ04A]|uniref:NAD(P)H-binding protein n=1 Tax=Burkholderia anthinoferrum TaxID=3090833 RepID=A0ABU5WH10_9BURK|nr:MULTISPECIES: NmrA family NAD(P)-binding protein [Burkholderia]MEB2503973.1 NAD(P)H-binding protein [Burkholderia anthinoferrum]MEB2530745.1 NAD(P)H-binding protein [Burkholderia anthinoferrum]MEB2560037.1 NAD(P)H-binding protein [Burkholderia anthinoferrum]MEB2578276.1 NAD(P)H-binding protein [Burkholderia anthinoferrum]MCA8107343.1 NAD(P)H-binding protein [Burkholderia sp. AU36459]
MYAITGITGKVGGALARELLVSGRPVRAVVRDATRAAAWAARGCEMATAFMEDASSLAAAFAGATGVFILLPPVFDPAPGFPEARKVIEAVSAALLKARPERVVCLSTIGAQADEPNLLTQLTLMEQTLRELPMPVTFLRPGWFMENAAWDVASARDDGVVASYLQPLDKPVPMVATADVGRVAAELLQQTWRGVRVVELEGPRRVSPDDLALAFARVLGRDVRAEAVDRRTWEALFRAQGMKHPLPRMRMLDGFNEGWIDFESDPDEILRGRVALDTVLGELVSRTV